MAEQIIETSISQNGTDHSSAENSLLIEVAFEVANQLGGIYTVMRSKSPSMIEKWGDRYCMLGPYIHEKASAIFEPTDLPDTPIGKAVENMRAAGFEVHFGTWLVTGRPKVVLFNPYSVYDRLGEIKYLLWEHHDVSVQGGDDLIDQVVALGYLVKTFFMELQREEVRAGKEIIAHFHEWMAGTAIPGIRREAPSIKTVFTTHATLLGRYLAMNEDDFYGNLPYFDWLAEARKFNIETQVRLERAAAHGAHVLTTVSEVTGRECTQLLGREPDVYLPNGLNIKRFSISHEIQNVHQRYKEEIHNFTIGHFFQSYSFNLDKTLYFFTSGRYEYKNKGYDLTLEALARLNYRMKQANSDYTVVMFFITKKPYSSINPQVLQNRNMMEKINQTCEQIEQRIGKALFKAAAAREDTRLPDMNEFVDDYWRLRYRRNLQSWKTDALPSVVTHNLYDDGADEILGFLRNSNLVNHKDDRVKIVYHPDFISPTSPLLGMEYGEFVRGCHMGIFPSYYEPWGYTPLECMASGVPSVTSDLAGFGDYVAGNIQDPEDQGLYVVNRREQNFDLAANQLTDKLFSFVQMGRRERISQRYLLERGSEHFDWRNLTRYYKEAYQLALLR